MVVESYILVTVNTAPERAKRLIGMVTESLKDQYSIEHVANCESIDMVKPTLEKYRPNLLFCASMWTAEESRHIETLARETIPGIKTYAIPHGMQVEKGPDAVVEHLKVKVPLVLQSEN